jgi:F-type H+-transporting ATPase subunit 6
LVDDLILFVFTFRSSPGKLVDASPEIEKELKQELDRITKVYGGKSGVDMTKFPTFEFKGKP